MYRSLTARLQPLAGFAVAYLTTGIVTFALFVGGTPSAIAAGFSDWFSVVAVVAWPLFVFFPGDRLFALVGIIAGLGVLGVLESTRLPIAAPRGLPTGRLRVFGEITAALLVAEVLTRLTSAAAFVAYLHIFGAYRGDPGTSVGAIVALYQDALSFFTAYLDLPALFFVNHLLPDVRTLPSGGPNQNHVLRGIGEIQFFDGIGFAIVVGYGLALVLSVVGVRIVTNRLRTRLESA